MDTSSPTRMVLERPKRRGTPAARPHLLYLVMGLVMLFMVLFVVGIQSRFFGKKQSASLGSVGRLPPPDAAESNRTAVERSQQSKSGDTKMVEVPNPEK